MRWSNARRTIPSDVGGLCWLRQSRVPQVECSFVLVAGLIRTFDSINSPDLMAAFAVPLTLLVVVVSLIVLVAFLGRTIDESEREWWASLSALVTLRALIWIVVMANILYVPGFLVASGPWVRTAVASGWLATAVLGVVTGRFLLPKAEGRGAWSLTHARRSCLERLPRRPGWAGRLAGLSAGEYPELEPNVKNLGPFVSYIRGVNGTSTSTLILIGTIAAVLYSLARSLIDVNLFSLNAMYANRLTRCYLGASRPMSAWPTRWRLPRDLRADAGAPSVSNRAPQGSRAQSSHRVRSRRRRYRAQSIEDRSG